jgi:tryptophanyl-tRNA synthetase
VARGIGAEEVEREFEGRGYGDFKQAVGESVAELLAPVRERYVELRPDEERLEAALREGADRARGIASGTLSEVRDVMGVGPAVGARV